LTERSRVYPAELRGVLRRLYERLLLTLAKRVTRALAKRVLTSLAEHDLRKRSVLERRGIGRMMNIPALRVLMTLLMRGEHVQKGRGRGAASENVVELSAGCIGRRPVRVIGPVIRRMSFAQYRDACHARIS